LFGFRSGPSEIFVISGTRSEKKQKAFGIGVLVESEGNCTKIVVTRQWALRVVDLDVTISKQQTVNFLINAPLCIENFVLLSLAHPPSPPPA
jgi:hypothetical protein